MKCLQIIIKVSQMRKGGINIRNYTNTNSFYDLGQERLQSLLNERESLEARIANAPPGSMRFIQRGDRVQFYLRTDPKEKSGKYIRKDEKSKIRVYMQKAYDRKTLKLINEEIYSLEKMLEHSKLYPQEIQALYSDLPLKVQDFIKPIDMSDEEYARKWLQIPFEGKGVPESKEIFKTNRGEYVRSKSELTIANALYRKGIPYKYECPLRLKKGLVVYPDFTVLNTKKRKVYYWEHRGMMDSPEYAKGAILKNKSYLKCHIIPGENLIITEETSANPLSTEEIDVMIKTYLC